MPIFCIYRTVGYQKEFEKRVAWEHDQFLGGDFQNGGEWLFLGGGWPYTCQDTTKSYYAFKFMVSRISVLNRNNCVATEKKLSKPCD